MLHQRNCEARQIPTVPGRIRWVNYRYRPFVSANSTLQHADELAVREAYWITLRADPSWLKRRIRRGLGVKALGLS